MARLYTAGAEIELGSFGQNTGPDGNAGASVITRDTSVFRSGVASWKCDSGIGNAALVTAPAPAFVDGVTYYLRAYFLAAAAPTAATVILRIGVAKIDCRMRTDGGLELLGNNVVQGSPSASVVDSQWHRVELKGVATATGNWTAAELQVDGTSIATWSGSVARQNSYAWGWTGNPGASLLIHVDDVALNDSTGAANNTWPGAGAVVLLKPTADSAVGTGWVGGAGATTNIFNGVKNVPPVGVADTGTNTSQIRNATSNATSYDATMTTYTAAGIGVGATINAVQSVIATAAPVVTSAKLGTVGVVSNPTITNVALDVTGTSGAFWAGAAAGTYPAGWKWTLATTSNAPSVTLGTAPVMRVTNSTASTRIADVCAMFMYVDYTPAPLQIPDTGMALTVT